MAPAAFRRAVKVPLLSEGPAPGVPANAASVAETASLALPFALDGFEEELLRDHEVDPSARHTAAAVRHLLTAAGDTITSAAAMAAAASGGDLLGMAQTLARLGYSVKLCSSSGGTLRSLKHSFLTATRPSAFGGEPTVWVIDPAFTQAFQVLAPTPRYAFILSEVPTLLVAPLPRVLRAVLLLGAELARCFEAKDLPLPPWRHADALATRYDTASSAEVRPDGMAVPTPSPAAAAAPGAAARKQQREAEQRERVQLRLLKLGVPASAIAAAGAELSEPASPPTPGADDSWQRAASSRSSLDEAVDSPRSVVQAAEQGALSRAFATAGACHERVCWGTASKAGCRQARRERLALQQRLPAAGGACTA